MTTDYEVFQEIGRVPALPPYLYKNIDKEVRRRSFFARSVMALAAALVLSICSTSFWFAHERTNGAISAELADELQTVSDYANGESLNNDLALYAFYEGETSGQ